MTLVIARSVSDEAIHVVPQVGRFASIVSCSRVACRPYARNDEESYEPFSPDITGPNRSQLSPLKRIICNCSSGAKSVGLVLILVPGR